MTRESEMRDNDMEKYILTRIRILMHLGDSRAMIRWINHNQI